MFSTVGTFFSQHWVAVVWTFITQYVWSAFIGALDAPTANSGPFYRFFFKFANGIAGNLSRAANTAVEGSPNFAPAVQKIVTGTGTGTVITQPGGNK